MTDEKREHWVGWATRPHVYSEAERPRLVEGANVPDSYFVPGVFFPNPEARDAALRDLEAMAALRAMDRVELTRCGYGPDDGDADWQLATPDHDHDHLRHGYGDDPADAILSALGEAPPTETPAERIQGALPRGHQRTRDDGE